MSEEARYEHGDMWCPQCAVWWTGRVRCPACYFALVYRPRPGEPFLPLLRPGVRAMWTDVNDGEGGAR